MHSSRFILPLFLLTAFAAMGQIAVEDTIDFSHNQQVNVFIGTNGMGHTFPGACYPYGAVQLSPDTDTVPHNIEGQYQPKVYNYCAGYQYGDSSIVGFSHTHFNGTGHSDLGDILIMPYSGKTLLNPGTADNPDGGYRQRYSHASEAARPGYYAVTLSDDSIRCEFTVTPHCGVHRYIYPKGANQRFVLDMNHGIYNYDGKTLWAQVNYNKNTNIVTGYRITNGWSRTNYVYFAIMFNKNVRHYGCHDFAKQDYHGFWNRFDTEHDFPEMGGRKLVTWFEMDPEGSDTLEFIVALSATSIDGAMRNLEAEAHDYYGTGNPFDGHLLKAEEAWAKRLSQFEAEGTDDQKAMLYTSLYHTLINPSLYQDVDGIYRGIDQNLHVNPMESTNYTVFSLWDTYRAFHPLITLLDENLTRNIVTSFANHFMQSPHDMLPVWSHNGSENWCMIGYHGCSVLADAFQKGLTTINDRLLLNALVSTSNVDYYSHTDLYKELGFVPFESDRSSVSVTLENAYEDWTIYRTLSNTNTAYHPKNGVTPQAYRERALSYRNVFDSNIGLARGKHANGSWASPFLPLSTSGQGFIEGNAWNYTFYVPHDVVGLLSIMGGDAAFIAKLDTLFTMYIPDEFFAETEDVTREGMLGGYVHGNEPSHHIPYLYMYTSQPWKTQYWVREIMNRMYRNHIDGLCGNDDCGQMSAWYLFSAMGFYPVCPASGQYVLGAPYLPYLKVMLGSGAELEIKAPKVSDKRRYVQRVRLNGEEITTAYLTHEQLSMGGVLEFDMGPRPNKRLFQDAESKPYSLSNEED